AILNQGRLCGQGAVDELVANAAGKSEIMMIGDGARSALEALGATCYRTMDRLRAVIAEAKLNQAIDAIRRANGTIISINPVQGSMEDYFVEKLQGQGAAQ